MYWRIHTVTPEQVMRQYGVYVVLAISILLNLVLFTMRPSASTKGIAQFKKSFEQLARDVTTQMLDSSYISYEDNTKSLLQAGELDPTLLSKLRQQGMLPTSIEDLKATVRTLAQEKTVVAVSIKQLVTGEQTQHGKLQLVPVDLAGTVATHSASGADEKQFHLRLWMGLAPTGKMEANPDVNTHSRYMQANQQVPEMVPLVADIEDLSGQPMPPGPGSAL